MVEQLGEIIHGLEYLVIVVVAIKKMERITWNGQNEISIDICTIITVIRLTQIPLSLKVNLRRQSWRKYQYQKRGNQESEISAG